MVREIAELEISPGAEEDFEMAYRGVRDVLASTDGCRSVVMTHSIESPCRYVLIVEWDSVEAHEQNFRGTDRFTRWRAALGPFFARPPHVEHFEEI
jgi:heme-degrading monooxygenase HmoA